jgi:hypothetical protein
LLVSTALAFAARRWSATLPRPKPGDAALLGLATFKLSRLLTKEKVTQPIREPFVEGSEPGEGSEVNCEPAGSGVRRAVGELLTCPFCVSVWVATALTAAFAIAPRAVRLFSTGLAAVVVADSSQYAYSGLRKAASS